MRVIDLHSHTCFSMDAIDEPRQTVENAISCGLTTFGITDHHYWFLDREAEYQDCLLDLQEYYKDRITVLCGIELATYPSERVEKEIHPERLDRLDFAIVEHLDAPGTMGVEGLLSYRDRFPIPMGIAHTDLFAYAQRVGTPIGTLLESLAKKDIFWEMNVNYDTIHGHREHGYVLRFWEDAEQQRIVRESGISLSVGFDCHNWVDYDVERVRRACAFIQENDLSLVDVVPRKERPL